MNFLPEKNCLLVPEKGKSFEAIKSPAVGGGREER